MKWLSVLEKLAELVAALNALAKWFAERNEEQPEPLKSSLQAVNVLKGSLDAAASSDADNNPNEDHVRF